MTVTIKLKSGLDRTIARQVIECEISPNTKVIDLLLGLHFPIDQAGVVLIDGKKEHKNYLLRGGETIKVFPLSYN